MKKYAFLLLTLFMITALTGCFQKRELPELPLSGTLNEEEGPPPTPEPEIEAGFPTAMEPPKDIYADDNKYGEGGLRDVVHTYFFDYTVNSAYLCDEFADYTPEEGFELLVADVTVTNTTEQSFSMYDNDFQAQWGEDNAHTYSLVELANVNRKVFPVEYILNPGDSRTGLLVFEVPQGNRNFSISYLEYYSNDTTGDDFYVFFTAEKQ